MRKLFNFVRSVFGNISKSDAELDLQESITGLIDSSEQFNVYRMLNPSSEFSCPDNNVLIKTFYSVIQKQKMSARLSMDKNFVVDINTLLTNSIKNAETVRKLYDGFKHEEIVVDALSAFDINIIRAIPHYSFLSTYSADFLNFLLTNETKVINKRWIEIPRATIEMITTNIKNYAILLSVYGDDPSKFEQRLLSLSKTILDTSEDTRLDTYTISVKDDILPTLQEGFIGSPIYSIRSAIATWQADRHNRRKDMKKLLEMRIINLRTMKDGSSHDATIEEDIKYLQGRVNTINAKIAKFEDSL